MSDAIEFMKHWRQCCKDEENCKGCFIESECHCLNDRRSDEYIKKLVNKVEKKIQKEV